MTTKRPNRTDVRSRSIKVGLLVLGALIVSPSISFAQQITSYPLRIYNVGASTPLSTTDLAAANVTCNQAPLTAGPTVNPNTVSWDDDANPGKVCVWTDPGTGPLSSVPFGAAAYEATLSATNSAGTSPESTRAVFTRPGAIPVARTGLKLVKR